MGTRADFYVGKGATAEWIGSIAFDGYRDGIDAQILQCQSPEAFRHAVAGMLKDRDDATTPDMGWPWPWETSEISDCAYFHFDGRTWDAHKNYHAEGAARCDYYLPCDKPFVNDEEEGFDEQFIGAEPIEYPNMKDRKNVTLGPRSGLLIVTAR